MLPLTLLNAARGKPTLVELKSGETLNGMLIACDNFMNLTLREVYQTSADGERFWKLPECYIKGATIKCLRLTDSLLDTVRQQEEAARRARQGAGSDSHQQASHSQRGQHGGRGGGTGGRGGGRGAPRGGGHRGGRGGGQRGTA
ncbi:unnamed protein product [Parajaminaea phylloscopi]